MYQAPEIQHLNDAVKAIRDGLLPPSHPSAHDESETENDTEDEPSEDDDK